MCSQTQAWQQAKCFIFAQKKEVENPVSEFKKKNQPNKKKHY